MPNLSRQLINTAGVNQDKVNDYTDDTDWPTTELAESGTIEPAVSNWSLRVPDGDIPDHRPGSPKYAASHNVVRVTVGSNVLFRGRNAAKDIARGDSITYRNQRQTINLGDYNQDLAGIIVHNWTRAEETDSARVQGLVAAYLSGSPRPSTNLNGSNFVITSSNTQTVPAKTYTGVSPGEILRELADFADKDVFVDRNGNLHYHGHDYAGYDSILRISDDPADLNTVTCFPIEPVTAHQEGADAVNALRLYYGPGNDDGNQHSVVANATGHRNRTDYWEDVFYDDISDNATEAAQMAAAVLAPLAQDVLTYTVTIGQPGLIPGPLSQGSPMTGDYIWMIQAGMRINFKAKAVRGGYRESGVNFGDAFELMHVRNVRWTMPTPDAYFATLELEKPRSLGPRRRGKPQPTATSPSPAPPFVPSGSDTLNKFYNANDAGGDDPAWAGLLENQGGSADGANGSDWYMYKSNSPNEYQTTWAYSAGSQLRITGYIGCRSAAGAGLKVTFCTLAAGSSGASVAAAALETHILATNPTHHTHADEWTAFSVGPFTAPVGTTSVALGHDGLVDFDEVSFYTVADTTSNEAHAFNYGDCPHESGHFLPSDYLECRLDALDQAIAAVGDAGAQVVLNLTNKSGGTVSSGDLVIIDSTTNESFTTTSTKDIETSIGIAQESIEADATGSVLFNGFAAAVNVALVSQSRAGYLFHGSNAKVAHGSNTRAAGAFGQFVTSGTTPSALIWGVGDQSASGGGGAALGAWTSYTPTLTATTTNPTLGSSTVQGRYKALDSKTYAIQILYSVVTGGAFNPGSGTYQFSLPAGLTSGTLIQSMTGYLLDSGTDNKLIVGKVLASDTKIAEIIGEAINTVTHNSPITWATGDQIDLTGIIEVA